MKITPKQQVNIIKEYTTNLARVIDLANMHNVTRHAIYKVLKKHGIDTTKHKISVSCSCCGKEITRTKASIRNTRYIFCSQNCYYAYIKAGQPRRYQSNRNGQRIGRAVVAKNFALQSNHVVHHEDGNNLNNSLENLKVFANQGDHIRYHRWNKDEIEIPPIWVGNAYSSTSASI